MKKFEIIGGYSVIHYHTKVFSAGSKKKALELAEAELSEDYYSYADWDEDIKILDDWEIIEVNEI